jgi:hypothetical protein
VARWLLPEVADGIGRASGAALPRWCRWVNTRHEIAGPVAYAERIDEICPLSGRTIGYECVQH